MNYLANTRCMFAWAFDRLLPQQLANVNERTHTPVVATVINAVAVEAFLIFYSYNNGVSFYARAVPLDISWRLRLRPWQP